MTAGASNTAERLGADSFATDRQSHLRIERNELCRSCVLKPCIITCPAEVYHWDVDHIRINYENCLETGACRVACHEVGNRALIWSYPRGGKGVQYRSG